MDSEQVKEIKKALASSFCSDIDYVVNIDGEPTMKRLWIGSVINLINELESENERLLNENWDQEDDLDNYHAENQELKDRIAELENSQVDDGKRVYTCPNCHISQTVNVYNGKVMFKYCPYCGAKMV